MLATVFILCSIESSSLYNGLNSFIPCCILSTTAWASSADPTPPSENEVLISAFEPFSAHIFITLSNSAFVSVGKALTTTIGLIPNC